MGLGDNAASALFFLRFGVDFLPYMYIMLGALTFVTTLTYSTGLGRFQKSRFFPVLLAGFALLLVVERGTVFLDFPALYPILWLTVNGIGMILGTLIWNVATDVCNSRQAKRLFPIFTSAGILGSVLGNSITGYVADQLGTENLLIVYAFLLILTLVVVRFIATLNTSFTSKPVSSSSLLKDFRTGFDVVRGSRLLRLSAYASVLFSVLFFSISFPFSKVAAASFPDEASVAGFLGLFSGIATAVTFFVSLFLANRVYSCLGIINSVFLLPVTYLVGFAVFGLSYTLSGAIFARFSQLVLLSGVCSAAWSAMYNVVPSQRRGQVVAFDNGVPSQIGVVLSGVLLILGEKILTTQQIFLMGMVVAVACAIIVWRMRGAYIGALIAALRAGRVEVFIPDTGIFQRLIQDPAAINVAVKTLNDANPNTRRLGVEMLIRMQAKPTAAVLLEKLADPDPSVRQTIVRALGEFGQTSSADSVLDALQDSDEDVRIEAIRALPGLLTSPLPPVVAHLQKLMTDAPVKEACQAAIALTKFGVDEAVFDRLKQWLQNPDATCRMAALSALEQITISSGGKLRRFHIPELIVDTLDDDSPLVRRCACQCLANLADPANHTVLIARLYDEDETVRSAAAAALRKHWPDVQTLLVDVLDSQNPMAESAALDAFPPDIEDKQEPINSYLEKKIADINQLNSLPHLFPVPNQMTGLMMDIVYKRVRACRGLILKGIGLLTDPETMETIRRGLGVQNAEAHSAALEALETVCDRRLTRYIIPIFEDEPEITLQEDNGAIPEKVNVLLSSKDPWLLILGALAAAEFSVDDSVPQLRELKSHTNFLVREAAEYALEQLKEDKELTMETLRTVPTLERILLLQKVPMFAELTPEDLQQVSELATEQFFPDQTRICREGDTGDAMYVIVSGKVEVVKESNGTEKTLAVRGEGEFVGEMAIIESAPRAGTLRALGDVRLLTIEGEAFKTILSDRPQVSLAVLQSMSRRLREISV